MAYDNHVPGCFSGNGYFAGHPADERRAFEWLTTLREKGIGWKAASDQIREYLTSRGFDHAHINQQLERASLKLKPWLID